MTDKESEAPPWHGAHYIVPTEDCPQCAPVRALEADVRSAESVRDKLLDDAREAEARLEKLQQDYMLIYNIVRDRALAKEEE